MVPAKLIPLLAQLFILRKRPMLVGSPGSAKTSSVKAAAALAGMDLLIAHPATYDPTDLNGIPYAADGEANFLPAGLVKRLLAVRTPTVCFLDDAIQAPLSVQNALMQLVLEREVNGVRIPDEVVWAAATNKRSDKAGGASMSTAFLNRFAPVLEVAVDDDSWCEWALTHAMPPDLVSFIRFKPQTLTEFSADSGRDLTPATTPRSIAELGGLVSAGIDHFEVLAGCAGAGFATEFLAFRKTWLELPDANEILKAPKKAKVPSRERPDVLYALMGALAFKAEAKNLTDLTTYLDRCPIEFAVLCMKDALNRDKGLAKSKSFETWAIAHREAFGYGA